MKKQDIRTEYTKKVTELLNQGYFLFPDTMSGHQGEIAHIDLSNGSEILRVLLEQGHHYERDEFWGDTVRLTVGKPTEEVRMYSTWEGTIWNNRLEPRFEIEWACVNSLRRQEPWYTTLEEGKRITRLQRERYQAQRTDRRETLGDAFKSAALRWLRKQPRMKTCKLEDIEKIERVWNDKGTRSFEIRARGQRFTIR